MKIEIVKYTGDDILNQTKIYRYHLVINNKIIPYGRNDDKEIEKEPGGLQSLLDEFLDYISKNPKCIDYAREIFKIPGIMVENVFSGDVPELSLYIKEHLERKKLEEIEHDFI